MMDKKNKIKIAVTYPKGNGVFEKYESWLCKDYENSIIEVFQLSIDKNNAEEIKKCDGIVLSGGVDIHPSFYQNINESYENHPENGFQIERDKFEKLVFESAMEMGIPILGICRGAQLINCILGGDLIQDLGVELNNTHKKEGKDKMHTVEVIKDSLLYNILQTEKETINSAHHQAVNEIADGLIVNAKTKDGIIEGFEWSDKKRRPFLLALQWHPERHFTSGSEETIISKKIREYFINEILKSKQNILCHTA